MADIERGFKVLKSEIKIAPVYHRLPQRIKAHAMICFIALILYRIMRKRLKEKIKDQVITPESALSILRRIQTHKVSLAKQRSVTGISTITKEQEKLYKALGIKKPEATVRYANL